MAVSENVFGTIRVVFFVLNTIGLFLKQGICNYVNSLFLYEPQLNQFF
jgi:hypothetical protein